VIPLMFRCSTARRAVLLGFFVAIATLAQPARIALQNVPIASPPPPRWPRSHSYHVQHYRIALTVNLVDKSISGETTVTLRPFRDDLREIELDAGKMTIAAVELPGGTPLKFRYEDAEKLFVQLDRPRTAQEDLSITIKYRAAPDRGLTFIQPTSDEPGRPYQAWSQGEAETNHYWFPCYDYPNDKATSETLITVDDKYQVVSNGELVEFTPHAADGTRTWHWRMDKPFSSYLTSIVIGRFAELKELAGKVPIISYVYPDQVENARVSFGRLGQMVSFFSKRIGYAYPYAKYAETTVRDFPGGMENISATTLGDTAVHDRRAQLDVSSEDLISHELAHQWFGDMVTCRDWSHLWLNESFATFFEGVWEEHARGQDDYLYGIRKNQQQYLQAWLGGLRRPVVTNRYSDPDAVFDIYAYARGGVVLDMLRFVLGEGLFWKAINHYVEKYAWQNVETGDLIGSIEEATGQNLQWFFDEWVYKMGHPEFEITATFDEKAGRLTLRVKQTQKPDEKRPWFQSPEFFTMPVDIALTTTSGEQINRVWIDKPDKEFVFAADSKPLIVNFDRGNYIVKRVKFDRGIDELSYQLLHDSDVMGRVRAAEEIKSGHSDAAGRALAMAATTDKFWGVRLDAVKALAEFRPEESRAALVEALKDKESAVRRSAIESLSTSKDPKLAGYFVNIIQTDQSYFAAAEAGKALGEIGGPQAYEALVRMLARDSWEETVRIGAMAGLAALADPRSLEFAVRYARPGIHPGLRMAAIRTIGVVGKGSERALGVLIEALKDRNPQVMFGAVQALGSIGDVRAIPAIEEAMKKADLPAFAKPVLNSLIERIKQTAEAKEKKDP
jgi:aminopeptidase N